MSITELIFLTLIGCLLVGVPIAFSLGIAAVVGVMFAGFPFIYMAQTAYTGCDVFTLMAVPGFILAGYLMQRGGISQRITDVAGELVGFLPGGLAIVTIISCMFFASVSGSGPATVAAIGSIMIPAMQKQGYSTEFSAGVSASGGTLGILIPPSNPMIIYGVVGNVSIAGLFLAGMIPGLVVGAMLSLVTFLLSRHYGFRGEEKVFSIERLFHAIKRGFWALLSPVIVLGGIYTGAFTPVEASIVAVMYAIFVGVLIYRSLNINAIYASLVETSMLSGTVLIIMGPALAFGRILTMYRIPQQIAETFSTISTNWFVVFMMINLFLILVGTFMETLAAIVLLTPIFLPVIKELGIDPIHFGILIVVTSEIGFLTPPLGVNLFVACGLTGLSLEIISRAIVPFILTLFICVVILTLIPQISTFLPALVGF
ncbi:MAG: TRAP transporter large permease [Deltaproteobacteria bacterium]|nr:TRAP transporter large permease [Deltaproteobacteria bacterium]MBW2305610.1 TRAP transporter large permease [Deltaproteobacteria bacterium]